MLRDLVIRNSDSRIVKFLTPGATSVYTESDYARINGIDISTFPSAVRAVPSRGRWNGTTAIEAYQNAPVTWDPRGRAFLKIGVLPNITGATIAARVARLQDICYVLPKDPALAAFIQKLDTYDKLTSADLMWLRNLWSRRVTASLGGLSATEVSAIEATAISYGITLP